MKKRLKKNNLTSGFTLIELLAVIVILAIIALIATPIILGIVEDARRDAFLRSVELVVSTTDIDIFNKTYTNSYTYTITDGNVSNLSVGIKNTDNMNGSITYDSKGNEEYAVHNGKWCVRKYEGLSKAEIKEYVEGMCVIPGELTEEKLGNYVFNNKEVFYNGKEQKLEIENLPKGLTVEYKEGNSFKDAGTYNVKVTIYGNENYKGTLEKTATLTIKKAPITITVDNKFSIYEDEKQQLTYTLEGIIYESEESIFELEMNEVNIGIYPINVVTKNDSNYDIKINNGEYIIYAYTNSNCFEFEDGLITEYYNYENNDETQAICPRNVVIPNKINGELVTAIGFLAFNEKNLTSIKLPTSVESIGKFSFYGNKLSGELDLSNTKLKMIYGFCNNQISSIKLPTSVESIGEEALSGNKLSGELDLSMYNNLKVIDRDAFRGSYEGVYNEITSIKLPTSIESIGTGAFADNKLSGELDLSMYTNLTSIGSEAFIGNEDVETNQITSIKLPNSIENIGSKAFSFNKLMGELDLSMYSNLKSIGYMAFSGSWDGSRNQITSIKFPSSIESIGSHAFADNKLSGELDLSIYPNLKSISGFSLNQIISIKLPNNVESIGDSAFAGNKLSGELDLSMYTNLKSIGDMAFSGSSDGSTNKIASVKLPDSVESIGVHAFYKNKLSGELDLSNTKLKSIGSQAFEGSEDGSTNQITSIKFPSSIESIGEAAFKYNKLSGELDLSNLTNLKIIERSAFVGSSITNQITSVKFPSSIESIGDAAFYDNKLESVTFYGRSDLTGITIDSYAWDDAWAEGHDESNSIFFVNE